MSLTALSGNYGAYSRSAEAEADIEALLDLAYSIKSKRNAEAAAAPKAEAQA